MNGYAKLDPSNPYTTSTNGDCDALANLLLTGPVSVALAANDLLSYSSGILSTCGGPINHAVLLVAITSGGVWTIKNSWSTGWGENGYARLAAGNTCYMCQYGGEKPHLKPV